MVACTNLHLNIPFFTVLSSEIQEMKTSYMGVNSKVWGISLMNFFKWKLSKGGRALNLIIVTGATLKMGGLGPHSRITTYSTKCLNQKKKKANNVLFFLKNSYLKAFSLTMLQWKVIFRIFLALPLISRYFIVNYVMQQECNILQNVLHIQVF